MDFAAEVALDNFLSRFGGVATRKQLLGGGAMRRYQLDNLVRRGELVTIAPATYCRPWDVDLPDTHEWAAMAHIGRCALSHLSGLRRWKLAPKYTLPVHITVPDSRMPRHRGDLVVHRVASFPPVVRLQGLPTVDLPTVLVTTWPMIAGQDQRGPVIQACREQMVSPAGIATAVHAQPKPAQRRSLLQLLELLSAGCESELEIWGHTAVFTGPGLRHGIRQLPVTARGRHYRLDLGFEREKLGVKMDGQTYHGSRASRERDLARDAALASAGWLIMRFTHQRLTSDPRGCQQDLLDTLARRT